MILNVVNFQGISKKPPKYSFTGRSEFFNDGGNNWRIKFYSSGTLVFNEVNSAKYLDIFLVGGGNSGEEGLHSNNITWGHGGHGGSGGNRKTIKNKKIKPIEGSTSYEIVIGEAGANSVFKWKDTIIATSDGGPRSSGGAGGSIIPGSGTTNTPNAGSPGNDGGPEFDEPDSTLYGGGGGGGAYIGGTTAGGAGGGGAGGGGTGGNGTPNTGGGGGGGRGGPGSAAKGGGSGGSGIVIIRNARKK